MCHVYWLRTNDSNYLRVFLQENFANSTFICSFLVQIFLVFMKRLFPSVASALDRLFRWICLLSNDRILQPWVSMYSCFVGTKHKHYSRRTTLVFQNTNVLNNRTFPQ